MKLIPLHLVLVFLLLQSCSRSIYAPSSQVVPLLEEGGNLKVGFDLELSNPLANDYRFDAPSDIVNLRLRGTYALTDKLGTHLESSISLDTSDYRTYTGLGIGYYSHLADNGFFQIYFLGRTGSVDTGGGVFRDRISAQYTSFALQPGIGYESEKFYLGLFTTLKKFDYSKLEASNPGSSTPYVLEPSAGFSYTISRFTIDAELGASFQLANKTTSQIYLGGGITYQLNLGKKASKLER